MHAINNEQPVSGAAMDTVVPRKNRRKPLLIGIGLCLVTIVVYMVWQLVPQGLNVSSNSIRQAKVAYGVFANNVVVRARANALQSVLLDAVDSGRVEEVIVKDGSIVERGQLLFRLSNPQRDLELLARESDYATQIANRANLEVSLESSLTSYRRRMTELDYDFQQAEKLYLRRKQLFEQKSISRIMLDEAKDDLEYRRRRLEDEKLVENEIAIKRKALVQMEHSIDRLASGLRLINMGVDALDVRAPVSGRLTDFHLQVGETVKTSQNVGRIDDPVQFKLTAHIDEFYLSKVSVGQAGKAHVDGRSWGVSVSRVYPQIRDGQFATDIIFTAESAPGLNPGQSLDVELELGISGQALIIPNGTYINEAGRNGLFVLSGNTAHRRKVRLGKRNAQHVEVLEGLKAGEKIIVSDYTRYSDTSVLQIVQ